MNAGTEQPSIQAEKALDTAFEDHSVTKVTRKFGYHDVLCGAIGVCLEDRRTGAKRVPKEGDVLRVYGELGSPIYGMDLNGEELFWLTPLEREAERVVALAAIDREERDASRTRQT